MKDTAQVKALPQHQEQLRQVGIQILKANALAPVELQPFCVKHLSPCYQQ